MSETKVNEMSQTKVQEKDETKVKKMLFILSKGTIENAYAAFVMANGARD